MRSTHLLRMSTYAKKLEFCFGSAIAEEFKKEMDEMAKADPAWEFDSQAAPVQAVVDRLREKSLAQQFANVDFSKGEPTNSYPVSSRLDDEDEGN